MYKLLPLLLPLLLSACSYSGKSSESNLAEMPAKLYKNVAELHDKPFTEVGAVSGSSCQRDIQSSPPSIAEARQDMLLRASRMNANAVILDSCDMIGDVSTCYKQALCRGEAVNVTE